MSRRLPHLNYANITATLALVVASSGTAYAAATIGSADVVDNSLKSIDLRDGVAVKSQDVADNGLTGADIAEATLDVVPEAGRAGVAGYQRVYGGNQGVPAGGMPVHEATCPAGKVAISGGFWQSHSDVEVLWSHAVSATTYSVAFYNPSGATREVGVHAVCVSDGS